MPESDAEARSRERREETQQQQELLNSIRDNNSIFTDGQMQGDNAKDWMSKHPGDAFKNIVKLLKKHQSILVDLGRSRNESTRKINNINDSLIKIDTRSDLFVDELGDLESEQKDMNKILDKLLKDIVKANRPPDNSRLHGHIDQLEKNIAEKFKSLKKMSMWAETYSKQTSKEIRGLQQEKRDLESDQGSMMEDIIELQKQYRELLSTPATKEGSVGVKLIRKGSIKKSKKKKSKKKSKKKKKSTKRKRSKKRR